MLDDLSVSFYALGQKKTHLHAFTVCKCMQGCVIRSGGTKIGVFGQNTFGEKNEKLSIPRRPSQQLASQTHSIILSPPCLTVGSVFRFESHSSPFEHLVCNSIFTSSDKANSLQTWCLSCFLWTETPGVPEMFLLMVFLKLCDFWIVPKC